SSRSSWTPTGSAATIRASRTTGRSGTPPDLRGFCRPLRPCANPGSTKRRPRAPLRRRLTSPIRIPCADPENNATRRVEVARRGVSREISGSAEGCWLGADLQTGEVGDRDPGVLQDLSGRDLAVTGVGLVGQHGLLVETDE